MSTSTTALYALSSMHHVLMPSLPGWDATSLEANKYVATVALHGCHHHLQAAKLVHDVIVMMLHDYHAVLKLSLLEIKAMASYLALAHSTLAKWRALEGQGQFPSFLNWNVLLVVFTKRFKESAEDQTHQSNIKAGHREYLRALLDKAIPAKRNNVKFLEGPFKPKEVFKMLNLIILTWMEKINPIP